MMCPWSNNLCCVSDVGALTNFRFLADTFLAIMRCAMTFEEALTCRTDNATLLDFHIWNNFL